MNSLDPEISIEPIEGLSLSSTINELPSRNTFTSSKKPLLKSTFIASETFFLLTISFNSMSIKENTVPGSIRCNPSTLMSSTTTEKSPTSSSFSVVCAIVGETDTKQLRLKNAKILSNVNFMVNLKQINYYL